MKALIIGGAGYIGGVTTRLFEEAGHQAVVLDNLSTGHKANVKKSQLVVGDAADARVLTRLFKGHRFEVVLDFAAKILVAESMRHPKDYFINNSFNLLGMVDVAVRSGVKNFILSSTAAVYGEPAVKLIKEDTPIKPINPYGLSKHLAELILQSYGQTHKLNWTALRYFNGAGAYGGIGPKYPFAAHLIPKAVKAIDRRQPLPIYGTDYSTPDGTGIRDFVHVKDLAAAHVAAAELMVKSQPLNQPINLGSGRGHSVLEVIKTIEKIAQRKIKTRPSQGRRSGDPARLVANNQLAKQLLGWQPSHGLVTMIRDYLDWWRQR